MNSKLDPLLAELNTLRLVAEAAERMVDDWDSNGMDMRFDELCHTLHAWHSGPKHRTLAEYEEIENAD